MYWSFYLQLSSIHSQFLQEKSKPANMDFSRRKEQGFDQPFLVSTSRIVQCPYPERRKLEPFRIVPIWLKTPLLR